MIKIDHDKKPGGENVFFSFDISVLDESKRLHFEFWFINLGLLSCYVVCGLIIAALGASVQDIAQNVNSKSTDIASIFVARGAGSIFGSFISAPIFTAFNAVKSLMISYGITMVVLVWIPLIFSLTQLHIAYFMIGTLTSIISSGSILLLRKIHKDRAGPWLGALGAALVSAGMIVPCVQMLVASMFAQFCLYSSIIGAGALWLRMLPCMREDVYAPRGAEAAGLLSRLGDAVLGNRGTPVPSMSPLATGRGHRPSQRRGPPASSHQVPDPTDTSSPFFMTPVASASTCSSSSFYTSACKDISNFTKSQQDLASMTSAAANSRRQPHHQPHQPPQHKNYQSLESGIDEPPCPNFESSDEEGGTNDEDDFLLDALLEVEPPHYWSDIAISLVILFIIGGSTAFSIYIETYVDDTGVVASQWKAMVLMLFFGAGTFANVAGIFVQMDIGDRRLLQVTVAALAGGTVGMGLIIGLPHSGNALWIGVALYGFASAVTVGFCFNIANRLSYPSAKSTSIIMMGSSIGVSLIPYLASLLYKVTHSPLTVMYIGLVSMLVPIALLFVAPGVSYLSTHKF